MTRIDVTMLPVGQGAMNLIEIYEEQKLIHLTLIDCGFDRTRPVKYKSLPGCTAASVDYAASKMRKRFADGGEFYLDYVLITHRDSDHWILFDNLLEKVFGTKDFKGSDGPITHLSKSPRTDVEEQYFAIKDIPLYLYIRVYTFHQNGKEITIEYTHQIEYDSDGTSDCQDSFFYTDHTLEKSAQLLSATEDTLSSCSFYNPQPPSPCLDLCLHPQGESQENVRIIGKKNLNPYSYEHDFPTPQTPEDLWTIWMSFLTDIVEELPDFQEILLLGTILEEDFQEGGFLHYTAEDICRELDDHPDATKIVGQFLWGGNPSANSRNNSNLTGVGKFYARSSLLASIGVTELESGQSFPLLPPFQLDILERLTVEQLNQVGVSESESRTSSAIQNNGTSAVSLLTNAENNDFQKVLFTGDATIHTFYSMYKSGSLAYSQFSIWTAPHHGSYATAKGVVQSYDSEQKKNVTRNVFECILAIANPCAMVIESGLDNRHGHPNISFYRWMKTRFQFDCLQCEPHYVYVNKNDTRDADWILGLTDIPLYSGVSSLSSLSSPPQPVALVHRFYTTGDPVYSHTQSELSTLAQSADVPVTIASPAVRQPPSPKPDIPSSHLFFRRK